MRIVIEEMSSRTLNNEARDEDNILDQIYMKQI